MTVGKARSGFPQPRQIPLDAPIPSGPICRFQGPGPSSPRFSASSLADDDRRLCDQVTFLLRSFKLLAFEMRPDQGLFVVAGIRRQDFVHDFETLPGEREK